MPGSGREFKTRVLGPTVADAAEHAVVAGDLEQDALERRPASMISGPAVVDVEAACFRVWIDEVISPIDSSTGVCYAPTPPPAGPAWNRTRP